MGLTDEMDRAALDVARTMFGKVLDERAMEFIRRNPDTINGLLAIRLTGKVPFPKKDVIQLCRVGIFSADKDGYYVSDIVEDLIDEVIKRIHQEDGHE